MLISWPVAGYSKSQCQLYVSDVDERSESIDGRLNDEYVRSPGRS